MFIYLRMFCFLFVSLICYLYIYVGHAGWKHPQWGDICSKGLLNMLIVLLIIIFIIANIIFFHTTRVVY